MVKNKNKYYPVSMSLYIGQIHCIVDHKIARKQWKINYKEYNLNYKLYKPVSWQTSHI